MEAAEAECECLLCSRTDLNLYEINFNSILIGSSLVDISDIIFEIFFAKINEEVVSFICEECKDLITQFYIFKTNAKRNLVSSSIFDSLKEFLESSQNKPEPIVKLSENEFIVTFEAVEETTELPIEAEPSKLEVKHEELEDEDGEEIYAEEATMEVDEEVIEENFFVHDNAVYEEALEAESVKDEERKIYQCECGVEVNDYSALQKHLHSHKPKTTSSICCGVGFKDFKALTIHEKAHENFEAIAPQLASNLCTDCNILFATEEDLTKHLSFGHDPILIPRVGSFEDHFQRPLGKVDEEDSEGTHSCGHCKKKGSENEIKIHLLLFHTTVVFCPIEGRCFEGTKQVRLFSEHIRNKHPELFDKDVELFSCRHCNQKFATTFEKLAHMKLCEAKPYQCQDHCNKRFATEWLLKAHLKHANGEERFSCAECGKRCVSRSDLQIHERAHTNERPYSCPICGKSFKTSANRSSHLDIHDSEKKHECAICGEKFQTRPILRKHKKRHDEKYQNECLCKICGKAYLSKPHLLRHLKSAHKAPMDLTTETMPTFFEELSKNEFN